MDEIKPSGVFNGKIKFNTQKDVCFGVSTSYQLVSKDYIYHHSSRTDLKIGIFNLMGSASIQYSRSEWKTLSTNFCGGFTYNNGTLIYSRLKGIYISKSTIIPSFHIDYIVLNYGKN